VADLNRKILDTIVEETVSLLIRKNRDYGDSYFNLRKEFSPVAFVVRLADKCERLKCLLKNEPQVKEEREGNTIKNIIGYCLPELYFKKRTEEKNGENKQP